ncbi:MAG TPA: hypothetical protein VGD62_09890 [Acidobacteriaceae bacterium]
MPLEARAGRGAGPGRVRRVRLSAAAVLAGWLAAALATTPFEARELLANAAPGQAASAFALGAGLWFGITLLLATAAWLFPVLGLALLVPGRAIRRFRLLIACCGAVAPWLLLAWRLGVFERRVQGPADQGPFSSPLLQLHTTFILVFAFVTTYAYSRLLARAVEA